MMPMDKKSLRKQYISIRQNASNKLEKSLIIKDKLISLLDKYDVIGVYASMDDEVSTDDLVVELLNKHKVVALPKIEDDHITYYQISSFNELKPQGKYQIREPITNNAFKSPLQAIIVPGICFDMKKNRLGFGRAYFDKYLSEHKNIYKIGVCFDEQVVEQLPIDKWDIKMDIVVTDKRCF